MQREARLLLDTNLTREQHRGVDAIATTLVGILTDPSVVRLKVLHCDDSEGYRRLLLEFLRPYSDIELVGQATDHHDVIGQAARLRPDVVVLDLDAKRDETVVSKLREVCEASVLVLSGEPNLGEDPIAMQADGFVSKMAEFDEIASAIRSPSASSGGRSVVDQRGAVHDVLWLGRLRRMSADERFTLYAQPIIDLDSGVTVQHELLLRMVGETGEIIAPAEFLPTAEQYGLIGDIDRWVVRQAAGFAAAGHAVQVNLSGCTLADPDIGFYVERELQAAGAHPGLVSFEITETALVSAEALAINFFNRVRALGCRVALDDFGTGYAGFGYLKRFPVDCLKIDCEFVCDLLTDPASAGVVRAIVQMAQNFGLETVAEGVEDPATLERVRALGVRFAQGYHFARPAPAADVLTVQRVCERAA